MFKYYTPLYYRWNTQTSTTSTTSSIDWYNRAKYTFPSWITYVEKKEEEITEDMILELLKEDDS